jgi:nucleoside phosphorylase
VKLLVVAAWEPELARFRERLSEAPAGVELVLATLGVGLVEASIAMTRCVALEAPAAALLLGTCGVFEGGHEKESRALIGSVVTGGVARLADASILEGEAALPGPMPAEVVLDRGLHDALVGAGAKSVQIANTVGITTSDALAERLAAKTAADVEHLEAFAFARACAAAQLPCAAALGVANVVGAKGRAEWLANHVRASQEAADVAWRALGAIVTSLASK